MADWKLRPGKTTWLVQSPIADTDAARTQIQFFCLQVQPIYESNSYQVASFMEWEPWALRFLAGRGNQGTLGGSDIEHHGLLTSRPEPLGLKAWRGQY